MQPPRPLNVRGRPVGSEPISILNRRPAPQFSQAFAGIFAVGALLADFATAFMQHRLAKRHRHTPLFPPYTRRFLHPSDFCAEIRSRPSVTIQPVLVSEEWKTFRVM